MKEGIKISLAIILVLGGYVFGYWSGSVTERISMAAQKIEAQERITEIENDLRNFRNDLEVQNSAWFEISQAGVSVRHAEVVRKMSSLADAGVPVGSFAVFGADGRIFIARMYVPQNGNDPFPVVNVYQWENDPTPRHFLKKLPD